MVTPRAWHSRAALLLAAAFAGCTGPRVGDPVGPAAAPGYALGLARASVDAQRHVVVVFTVTRDGAPLAVADLPGLRPSFTLARLGTDPVSGLAAWRSVTLTGAALRRLPLGGPGTPSGSVLANVRQPGAETAAASQLAALGGGSFAFTFATALPPDVDPSATLRVGAWLGAVTGTDRTSATLDVVPSGGAPAGRETALDQACDVCHGRLTAHGGFRRGLRLCLTCHTLDNADPDTVDPAALRLALTAVPEARTVVAGTARTAVVAQLLGSTAAVSWLLSPPSGAGTLSEASGATVSYTPPATVGAAIAVTLTASAVGFSTPVALTVLPRPAAPAVLVNPAAQAVVAGGPPLALTAELLGASGEVAWTLSPASGAGTLSPASGPAVSYQPPAALDAATTVTVTASAGGATGTATFSLAPAPSSGASPFSDPNPLDMGRMVHRIHRGRNLPTLYLASSTAPAPALPPGATAFPLPFLPGRNAPAPGARHAITGYRSSALVVGEVVSRSDNGQPARTVVEGIAFPRDLRDCEACHAGAPDAAQVQSAVGRRTCQGCHPEVWFGAAPVTDLTHFAHTGGPQADDARCAECHVTPPAGQTLLAPIAEAHLPPAKSPHFNRIIVAVEAVEGLSPGRHPSVTFTVRDGATASGGHLDSLGAPSPATVDFSPVPRALGRLAITVSGPSTDLLTGNAPLTEVVPLTATADGSHRFRHTFAAALPAGASGTWALGIEARRQATVPLFDPASQAFRWPYTGETVIEFADNPVVWVDTASGAWPGGAPVVRRAVVERKRCQACHQDLNLHGGLRHDPDYCVLCHTPDATDWGRRPKGPDGNVNLATAYPDGRIGTYDDLEERSIHFKVMIHRIHAGEGQGTARLDLGAPHVIYGFGGAALFFDEVRFPGPLQTCTACHLDGTWGLDAIPAGAQPTTANESATIVHAATAAHAAGEAQLRPMAAACLSCHGTAFATAHAAGYTTAVGVEQCAQCHLKGTLGVAAVHGLPGP